MSAKAALLARDAELDGLLTRAGLLRLKLWPHQRQAPAVEEATVAVEAAFGTYDAAALRDAVDALAVAVTRAKEERG